ncbi:carbohydrate deacetylase [Listeria marthii]|uniref:carbohydrate deacetylase n=1 Tax=Listeria marthii TaxID=529731 RepID=UPI001627265F|nr:carbohydrate deacetylase [Listeria marthii]MBC1999997.1 carbohydrate deacetylase [Listeria marthii]MBF2520795.1 carbohydrate deacetylase [Listeria marthii]MBF2555094.1 carbohydrate deacetylase [Listeria marthii]MBF2588720.1 carbohydrate deacetylase [Listeria marthii]MBF2628669.1 carbohydrate deacetylase [Listeria marthii]
MKLIINADDFGFTRAINYGIIDAHNLGVLTSTTLMVTMPAFEHAVELSKQTPTLGIGLHLNLTLGKPMTNGASLVDETGEMIKPKFITPDYPYVEEEVYQEFKAQYQRFVQFMKKKPSHLDSHLFSTDIYQAAINAAKRLAEELGIPLRNHDTNGFEHVEFMWEKPLEIPYGAYENLDYIYDYASSILCYDYVEIMTHPGYLDSFILENSTFSMPRANELESLISTRMRQFINDNIVELISYHDIPKK